MVLAQTQAQKDDAKWLLERLTGVKWASDSPVLQQAIGLVAAGNRSGAAALAVNQSQFLNVTVKNFGLLMSTREETIRIPLNDFAASIIGITRDGTDARELLYGNFYYVGDPAKLAGQNIDNPLADNNILGQDVLATNNHYEALDNKKINIGDVLLRVNNQRIVTNRQDVDGQDLDNYTLANNPDPAGVLTSRTWIGAHAVAGTNRRPVEFTFRQFMCIPIEQWADASSSDVRIGRDIDRFPGGDHTKFQTSCKSCHTVMDGFRGAWAKWDFDPDNGMAVHTAVRNRNANGQGILNKMNQNNQVYPGGYVTIDDSWVNNAIRGVNNSTFGWRGLDRVSLANSGNGVNSFGRLVANSQRFSTCMAKRVFKSVCRKDLPDAEISVYAVMGTQFESMNYNLKNLFQLAALHPRCK